MRGRHERRNRYSIRKFSVGVASVVIATLFCGAAGGPQVVQAADGANGTTLQGVSLDAYKRDLRDQLEKLSLSEGEKEGYRNRINNETEHSKLAELETIFTQLREKEIQDAVNKANLTLPKHIDTLLEGIDKSRPGFPELLKNLQGIVTEYREQLEDATSKKAVEDLVEQAQREMDALITKYQAAPGTQDNQAAPGTQDNQAAPGTQGNQAAPGTQGNQAAPGTQGNQTAPGTQGNQAGGQAGGQAGTPQTPPAEKEQPSKPVLPLDSSKPSSRNQTFTGTVGNVNVTVVFDKPVNADKVTIKEVTQPDLVERIGRQAGGGSIRLFDLTVTRDGKETHVNEGRTVRLALEGLGEGVQVYHVREDGKLDPIPSRVEDGHVIFRINHFSLFAIKTMSTKSNQETPSNQATPSTQTKSTTKETTKDTTSKKTLPNTGTADSTALLAAATTTAVLGLGLAGRRRKED